MQDAVRIEDLEGLADLDAVSRERNDLAAQLAALRSAAPPAAAPARRSRAKPKAAELPGLLEELESATPPTETAVKEFVAACPQHLSDVHGIGSAYETRLYAAGIGSYWQLSQTSDEALAEALELEEGQREQFDFAAVKSEALRLARETRSEGRRWNQEPPDDLEPIEGIGKAFEKRLYDAGICTYDAIARMTPAELAEVCPSPTLKESDYAQWIGQAMRLAAAKES